MSAESKWGRVVNAGTCRYCGERILWVRTHQHRTMPVNREYPDLAHFATCPSYPVDEKRAARAESDAGQLSLFDVEE